MARSVQAAADRKLTMRGAWRCLQSADFAAALAAPILGKSPHFVLHHLAASPASSAWRPKEPVAPQLSTSAAPNRSPTVDNNRSASQWWLGLVVPKRHARRSVTRSLLKRQMRMHAEGNRLCLPPGQWVIRLRAPFDPKRYPSAASAQLRDAARLELAQVFASAVSA
ncbi:MAG TPA: ribonuclease P protein component [Acidiferrobacterales bacterium]|nr:ribonuclease P protein component [Acidiferrobacterales bacterium]